MSNQEYNQASWPDSSREHLPIVEAEINVGHVLEKIFAEDLRNDNQEHLTAFIDWANESLSGNKATIASADIITIAPDEVAHRITGLRGYESINRDGKKPTTITPQENLGKTLNDFVKYLKRISPDGFTQEFVMEKFKDSYKKAMDTVTSPEAVR